MRRRWLGDILPQRMSAARSTSPVARRTLGIGGTVLAAGTLGWLGLRVRPRSIAPALEPGSYLGSVALPRNLPPPIARHFRAAFGERVPRVETAVEWGTARMRVGPLWLPLRYQMSVIPGRALARHMEVTWFGQPVFKGLDTYIDGEGVMDIGKTVIRGPEIDEAANLALWAEALSTPSILFTDPHVRWEPIDDTSARLVVPFGAGGEEIVVHVNPRTSLISEITANRYRTRGKPKEPWKVEFSEYRPFNGVRIATRVAVTWLRDRRPWSYWTIDGIAFNVPVMDETLAPVAVSVERSVERHTRSL